MRPDDARDLLADVGRARGRTRLALGRPWPPLLVFGAATAGSAAVTTVPGGGWLIGYWVLVGVVGGGLVRTLSRRRATTRGVREPSGRTRLAVVMFGACLAAAVAVAVSFGPRATLAVVALAVLAGYAALGAVQRDVVPVVIVAPGVAAAVALAVTGTRAWVVELVLGAALALAGLALWRAERVPAVAARRGPVSEATASGGTASEGSAA